MIRTACFVLLLPALASAETGQAAWLRYAPLAANAASRYQADVPRVIVTLGDAAPVQKARDELVLGVRGMLGQVLTAASEVPPDGAIVVGTIARIRAALPQ